MIEGEAGLAHGESFTYEDYLALSGEEKRKIDDEVDAMPREELVALGKKLADFIHQCDIEESHRELSESLSGETWN